MGIAAAFVGWASSFAFIEIADLQTSELTEHELVIGIVLILVGITLIALKDYLEPMVTVVAAAAGTAGLWPYREFPEGEGYSPEYWSAVVVTSLVFIAMVAALQSDYIWRRKRAK